MSRDSGFERLLSAVDERRKRRSRAIGRLYGPARTAVAAAWATLVEGPTLMVTARDPVLVAADLEALLAALGAGIPVLRLPGTAVNPYAGVSPHAEVLALRAEALFSLAAGRRALVVTSPAGFMSRTVAPERLLEARVSLKVGEETNPAELAERLVLAGYRCEDPVSGPGEFGRRGGILDVFPQHAALPTRVEWFGEAIEELRPFEPATQRSGEHLNRPETLEILPATEWIGASPSPEAPHPAFSLPGNPGFASPVFDYCRGMEVLVEEPERVREAAESEIERVMSWRVGAKSGTTGKTATPEALLLGLSSLDDFLANSPPDGPTLLRELEAPGGGDLPSRPVESFRGRLPAFLDRLRAKRDAPWDIHVFAPGRTAESLSAKAQEAGIRISGSGRAGHPPRVRIHEGRLSQGFEVPDSGLEFVSGAALVSVPPRPPSKSRARVFASDFRDLKPGDLVVHADHGIGRFVRITRLDDKESAPDLVQLEYAKGARLYVPVDRLDLLDRYQSASGALPPALDRLGGTAWASRKGRAQRAIRNIAGDLIRLYAERRQTAGFAFPRDTPGMEEFEAGFEWTETEDQARTIREVMADMESEHPMDRLVAGDVGFGKTEVALRAAFKAAMHGKQVAVLTPTTVLASQHARLFQARFREFPVVVEMLSRFRTPKERKQVVAGLADGTVDIVIGTHRLLSKDVSFRDLGLLVIDEEQRFGVAAKERLKQLATRTDHLALTATPIPRTLNMSLSGIRDMSVIETAPRDRLAVHTHVIPFDPARIAEAIRYELSRAGQIYFVHNRIRSLPAMRELLLRAVPEARVIHAHGQMPESALEQAFSRFQNGEADVLLSTTIVENGLDLPRVNTLIVNRADAFGLAQLYQLRGRVGRSTRRAYAYMLVPAGASLSEKARPRLAALREFSDLGAGFRVAALDMELRGVGDLLGAAQHGHLEAVGFDLYYRLLDDAVAEARGHSVKARCAMQLRFQLRVPDSYLSDPRHRMWLYKRVSIARDGGEIDRLRGELRDRFGPPPPEVDLMFRHVGLRVRAEALGYARVSREGGTLVMDGGDGAEGRSFRTPLPEEAGPEAILEALSMALAAIETISRSGSPA